MPALLPLAEAEYLLNEFIRLLTSDTLEPAELAQGVADVLLAYIDPDRYFAEHLDEAEDGWMRDCGFSMTEAALRDIIWEEISSSDKIDELYEQVQDQFEDPLPEPPASLRSTADYFRFINELLRARGPQPGGYELLEFGDSLSDNIQVVVTLRQHTPRLLALGQQFEINIRRTVGD